eukprot:Phypoly_transcript_07816.p1 GENE.Phypoly_transcript_07816~~Phypoly_transcript_07816.p1  ORF type:complete len:520 (+),score=88.36 Phypoly_transcript_07816:147-1562(+)
MGVVTNDINNEINSYTGWQTISGSSSSATYTFSGWKVSIALITPNWKPVTTNEFLVGWQQFNFTIESNYHVCGTSWPNPCEDGNMYVYTTDDNTQMYLDTVLDLTQSPPFINVTATDLNFDQNGIQIFVQCTNTFCLIPTQDIADAVAQNFVSLFTTAVANAARASLQKQVTKYRTEFSFTDGLGLDMESNWWIMLAGTGENPMLFVPTLGGFYTNVSGAITQPPFTPSFAPPLTYLESPKQDLNIGITEYFFSSLTWALGSLGFFNKVITSSEVPAESPVQLNTNDAFFLQVVPGLSAYPEMDITITTTLVKSSTPTIDAAGLHVWGTNLTFDFALSNSSYSHHGWTLSNVFDIDFTLVASASGSLIVVNATISNFSSVVDVTESDMGTITGAGFSTLYQLLESQIKVPGFAIHLPESVSASNPTVALNPQYIALGVDFAYSEELGWGDEKMDEPFTLHINPQQSISINN